MKTPQYEITDDEKTYKPKISVTGYFLEITVIVIIDFGGVTSTFGCYLYSARKVGNTGYSSLISNYHKLKKYILITMNCCNRRLLLLLEDDGLMVDDIILPS